MVGKKFAIIGSGSWGTALACMLSRAAGAALIYTKEARLADEINNHHTNSKYLPNTNLPSDVTATANFDDVLEYEFIVIAVPSYAFDGIIDKLQKCQLTSNAVLLIASKGMSSQPLQLFSSTINSKLKNNFAFIHGPNFAREVAIGERATITVSCEDESICKDIIHQIKSKQIEAESTSDIMTVQIASMTKNIFAIKSGIMQSSGDGENLRASLISQALHEIQILSNKFGGNASSLSLAAVVGDLVLTCYSKTSRNTKFGYEFHQNNYSKDFLQNYPTLVEGVQSARLLKKLITKLNINLPIIEEIASLVEDS
ncbi:MAG: hypothetical protein DGJ47_000824 [Rickettsiaceae bacterium]